MGADGAVDVAESRWVLNQFNLSDTDMRAWAETIAAFQDPTTGYFRHHAWEPHPTTDLVHPAVRFNPKPTAMTSADP